MGSLIFTVIAQLLSWYLKKHATNDQAKKDFIKFNEAMFNQGLTKNKMRLSAHNQIIRVNDMWKEDDGL